MTKRKTEKRKTTKRKPTSGRGSSTAASRIIDAHYEERNIRRIWTTERVERLARGLNLTMSEVASILAIPYWRFNTLLKERNLNGPACVLLTLIENAYLGDLLHDTIELFNFNGRPEDTEGDGVHDSTPA